MKKNKISWILPAVLLCIAGINSTFSQTDKRSSKKEKAAKMNMKSDTISDMNKPQPYDKVITSDATLFKGVFVVAKVKDRYLFEIPYSVLDRDFQITSRIGKGPSLFQRTVEVSAGKLLESMQIRFTKGPNDNLFIKRFVYDEVATDTSDNGLYRALKVNDLQPVMSVFKIKAYGKESIVIDVTDYINSDLRIFAGNLKELFQGASFQADRSYIKSIEALPMSIELSTVKTYDGPQSAVTTEVNTSFLLLPLELMPIRYSDERVGYSEQLRTDLDQDPQRIKKVGIINRWFLEPRAEDLDKYEKGELVEPKKPIVFYINPTTPKKWVPYIKKAVNNWQAAFEKAGFKNAIYAKESTLSDSLWNAKNGGLNTIDYAASLASDIIHKLVIDPRSGEILQANIEINHNVLNELYNNYVLQAGTIDKRAQNSQFSNELMGELLSAELTGHIGLSLGLLPNAGAASTVPLEKLRDKQWVAKHGISPSIMQNALINYVAQPEDNISQDGILGRVGDYDKWAISWGYRIFPKMKNPIEERNFLRRMITDSLRVNPQLYYGAQVKLDEVVWDPRNQPNNLSDNIVEASKLGIKNLRTVINKLPKWNQNELEIYSTSGGKLGVNLSRLIGQYYIYVENVSSLFGTYYYNPQDPGSTQKVFSSVPLEKQKAAMAFYRTELFEKGPEWLINNPTSELTLDIPYNNDMYLSGTNLLSRILDFKKLKNINATAERFGGDKTYTLISYLNDLDKGVWTELNTSSKVSSYHMLLQKMYLKSLGMVIDTPRDVMNTNTIALVRGHLIDLKQKISNSAKISADKNTRDHYLDLLAKTNFLLNPKRVVTPPAPALPSDPNAKKSIQQGSVEYWEKETVEY